MDFASIHGQDESNFSFRSQHRLPTQSAAAALNALKENGKFKSVSLGKDMEGVDGMISDVGGVRRGVVTEIWGPPGVGKTSFGMELAATTLRAGERVLWLSQDPMPGQRFDKILAKPLSQAKTPSHRSHETSMARVQGQGHGRLIRNFRHLPWPTIAHLSARLLMSDDPKSGFPPPGTALFVIDKLDELIDKESPRDLPEDEEEKDKRANKPPESLLNYWKTTHHAIRMLNKFAAKHNVAVVVLTPIDTKQEIMVSAIDTQAWEMGVATRIMLIKQHTYAKGNINIGRTLKKDGVVRNGEWFGFSVEDNGLREEHVYPQKEENDPNFYHDNNARANSHAIQREVGSELGWDRPILEEQYLDAKSEPGLDRLSMGNSPPPPSSPPILTTEDAPPYRSIHPPPSARTPSPPPLDSHQTQYGTPVRSVPARNIFAEDPLPDFEDEAPKVSYLSQEVFRSAEYRRYDLDVPPTATSQQQSQRSFGPTTLPRTAYTDTSVNPRQQRRMERSAPGYLPP